VQQGRGAIKQSKTKGKGNSADPPHQKHTKQREQQTNPATKTIKRKQADQPPHQLGNETLVVCGCGMLSRTTSDVALLAHLVAQLDDIAGAVVEALLLHAAPELPVAIL
jgi:hypothetical protein